MSTRRGLGPWLSAGAEAFLSLLLVGSVWVVPYLPTNDGPGWIFATHAETHYADAASPYQAALVPLPQFAARGMSLLYGPLDAWLGWQRGLQVALSLLLLLAAWGFLALVRALAPGRRSLGLLGFPLALTWEFYSGFWPFAVASALALFVLAVAVRFRAPSWVERSLLAALLFVVAIAHVFVAALTGAVVAALAMVRARADRRPLLAELARVGLTGLPAASVLGASVWVARNDPRHEGLEGFRRLPWSSVVAMFPRTVAPGPLDRALVMTALVVVAATVAGARVARKETSAPDRALGAMAVLFLLAGAFAPFQIPNWQGFSQRFVPLGAALALAAFPLERAPARLRSAAYPALFTAAAAALAMSYAFHRRLVALCPDAIDGLLHMPVRHDGKLLALSLRPTEGAAYDEVHAEVPLMQPLLHMGSAYATVLGAVPAMTFSGEVAVHAFRQRPDPRPVPDVVHFGERIRARAFGSDLSFRNATLSELANFGMPYEEVALFGTIPSDVALWRDRGYVVDWKGTATLVAHFIPCRLEVTMPASSAAPPPVFDVSGGGDTLIADGRVFPLVEQDVARFVFPAAPCGPLAVRARWHEGGGRDAYCANADAHGDLRVHVTRRSGTVACDGRGP